MTGRPERAAHLAEAVRATPGTVNQDEDGHERHPFRHLRRRQRGSVISGQASIQTCLRSLSTEMPDLRYKIGSRQ
jgi:hypothetical protein